MIYPWDIARFRQALDDGLMAPAFDRFHFRKTIVRCPVAPKATEIRPAQLIAMKGPSAIFGSPAIPSCLQGAATSNLSAPAAIVHEVENGTIIGLTAVLDPDGALYTPAPCRGYDDLRRAAATNASNAEGYVLREEDGGYAACHFAGRPARHLPGTALLLSNLEIGNYGSFLIRVMPQLLQAKRVGHDFDFYISADRAQWLPRAIELLDLPRRPILLVQEICGDTVGKVIMHVTPSVEGLFDDVTLAEMRHLAGVCAPRKARRLYVGRQLSRVFLPHYRLLLNEADVVARFQRRGFEIAFPETLDLLDQIRLFAEARSVAGPSGSGMLNAVFAESGCRVLDLEGFNVTVRQHAKVYSSAAHRYAFCFGILEAGDLSEPSVRSWKIDIKALDDALDWLDT